LRGIQIANRNKLRQEKEMDFLNENEKTKDKKLIQVDNSLNISREENEFSKDLLNEAKMTIVLFLYKLKINKIFISVFYVNNSILDLYN